MRQEPATLSTEELHALLAAGAGTWLVYAPDCATFIDGHIPGSLSATDAQLLAALPKDAEVVVYGEDAGAMRAKALAVSMQATGRPVHWYDGGLNAWSAAGLAVEGSAGREQRP